MGIERKFLDEVQRAGWIVKEASDEAVLGGCPRPGCGLKVALKPGVPIPKTCSGEDAVALVEVRTFDDARKFLRERREDLGLSIKEMEEICGIAADFAAKFEKDDPSKIPNAQTFIEWAQGLGYVVFLKPGKLSSLAMETIAITRHRRAARLRQTRHHRSRRANA